MIRFFFKYTYFQSVYIAKKTRYNRIITRQSLSNNDIRQKSFLNITTPGTSNHSEIHRTLHLKIYFTRITKAKVN